MVPNSVCGTPCCVQRKRLLWNITWTRSTASATPRAATSGKVNTRIDDLMHSYLKMNNSDHVTVIREELNYILKGFVF